MKTPDEYREMEFIELFIARKLGPHFLSWKQGD